MAKRILLTAKDKINTDEIVSTLGLPCFVKANQAGSSFGVSKVHKKEDLSKAIEFALKEDNTILIESFLEGIEVSIGVITYQDSVRVWHQQKSYLKMVFLTSAQNTRANLQKSHLLD